MSTAPKAIKGWNPHSFEPVIVFFAFWIEIEPVMLLEGIKPNTFLSV